ncbi:MAG: hypothetical protein KBD63_01440 [Bacteriovoracaceae bacterium]|nr:hypothetical protein [Bacteriovoracaceae bacterium]
MSILKTLCSFLLFFSFILPSLSFAQSECLNQNCCSSYPRHEWKYNSCVLSAGGARANKAFEACTTYPAGSASRDNCMKKNAATDNTSIESYFNKNLGLEGTGGLNAASNMAIAFMGLAWLLKPIKKMQANRDLINRAEIGHEKSCHALSWKLIKSAAGVAALGDLTQFVYLKVTHKLLQKQYTQGKPITMGLNKKDQITTLDVEASSTTTENSNALDRDAQIRAFNYVAGEHGLLKRALSIKSATYSLSAGLFAAAATAAILEATKNPAPDCFSTPSLRQPKTSFLPSDYSYLTLVEKVSSPLTLPFYLDEQERLDKGELQSISLNEYEDTSLHLKKLSINSFPLELISELKLVIETLKSLSNIIIPSAFAQGNFNYEQDVINQAQQQTLNQNNNSSGQTIYTDPSSKGEKTEFAKSYKTFSEIVAPGVKIAGLLVPRLWGNPIGRTTIALSSAGMGGWLAGNSIKKTVEVSERYNQVIEKRSGFEISTGMAHCSPADRQNPRKPSCYCYNDAGQARGGEVALSQACQIEFGWSAPAGAPSEYDLLLSGRGCWNTQTQSFDPTCDCRQNNSCATTTYNSSLGGNLGGTLWESLVTQGNNLMNGNTSFANLDGVSLLGQASRLVKQANDLKNKYNKNLASKGKKPVDFAGLEKKFASELMKGIPKGAGDNYANLAGLTPSLPTSENLQKAAEEVAKQTGTEPLKYSSGAGSKGGIGSDELFASLDSSSAGSDVMDVGDTMDKEFDYGDNDINKRPQDSLWNIISHRYNQTALRRLFQ